MATHRDLGSYLVSVLPWGGVVSELKGTRHACMLREMELIPGETSSTLKSFGACGSLFKKERPRYLKEF